MNRSHSPHAYRSALQRQWCLCGRGRSLHWTRERRNGIVNVCKMQADFYGTISLQRQKVAEPIMKSVKVWRHKDGELIKSTVGSVSEQINGNDGIMPERNPIVYGVLPTRRWGLNVARSRAEPLSSLSALRDTLIDGTGCAIKLGEVSWGMTELSVGTFCAPVSCGGWILPDQEPGRRSSGVERGASGSRHPLGKWDGACLGTRACEGRKGKRRAKEPMGLSEVRGSTWQGGSRAEMRRLAAAGERGAVAVPVRDDGGPGFGGAGGSRGSADQSQLWRRWEKGLEQPGGKEERIGAAGEINAGLALAGAAGA